MVIAQLCMVAKIPIIHKAFLPPGELGEKQGEVVGIFASGPPMARFNNGYRDTYMGAMEFQTGARVRLIRGKAELSPRMDIIRN